MLRRLEAPVGANQGSAGGGRDIASQYFILRRRWRTVAGSALGLLVATFLALLPVAPRYTASTQVLFDPRRQNIFQSQGAIGQAVAPDTGSVESEVTLIQSFNVIRRMVERLQLDKPPAFGEAADAASPWSGLMGLLSRGSTPAEVTPDGSLAPTTILAIRRVRENLTVRRVGLTYVMEISFTSADPVLAARVADGLAQAYLTEQLEARYEVARRASGWFSERLVSLREQLRDSEAKVSAFRVRNDIVDTAGGALDKQQVAEISRELTVARTAVAEKKARLDQVDRSSREGRDAAAVSEVLQSGVVSGLRAQEAEVARREADLVAKYSSGHPQVVAVRAEHADVRRAIATQTQRIVASFANEYEIARTRERSLEGSLAALTRVATQNESGNGPLRELQRELDANRMLYENFLARSKEAREETTLEASDSRVISPAVVPTGASYPRKGVVLSVAGVLGLMAGVALALLLDSLESGFMTAEQVEDRLDLPVLAVLPHLVPGDYETGMASIPQYVERRPLTRFSESVRGVRVAIGLSDVARPPRIVLVTSSVPGEGKSTIASSLAISAAASGQRVLLIDADMRHPTTSKLFSLEKGPGLVDLLAGAGRPAEVVSDFVEGRLTVLPAGSTTKNAPDLLGSPRMASLLKGAREAYDLVVIDTPPVTAVVDSQVIANHVDRIVFVIEWARTPRQAVARAMNILGDQRDRLAGAVLNNADLGRMRRYSSYDAYQARAYQDYYGR